MNTAQKLREEIEYLKSHGEPRKPRAYDVRDIQAELKGYRKALDDVEKFVVENMDGDFGIYKLREHIKELRG